MKDLIKKANKYMRGTEKQKLEIKIDSLADYGATLVAIGDAEIAATFCEYAYSLMKDYYILNNGFTEWTEEMHEALVTYLFKSGDTIGALKKRKEHGHF